MVYYYRIKAWRLVNKMDITLVFPKAQCYDNKDDNTQRIYNGVFKKYVKMLNDAGCRFEIQLEDKLAFDILGEMRITPNKVISCISPSDVEFLRKYPDIDTLPDRVLVNYTDTEKCVYDVEKKYSVSPNLVKEGREKFFAKRTEIYRKRYKEAFNRMLMERMNVLQFRTDTASDRGNAVSSTVHQGDGRLCMEVHLSGRCTSYYGGVFIPEDTLPTILSLR